MRSGILLDRSGRENFSEVRWLEAEIRDTEAASGVMHPRLSVSEMCTYPLAVRRRARAVGRAGCPPGRSHRRQGRRVRPRRGDRRAAASARCAATTVITRMFDLSDPTRWDATRKTVNDAIDLAAEVGGCTYFTPGRRDGRSFDELAASFADAVAPCAKYAESRGVPARDRAVVAHRRVLRAHPPRRHRRRRARRDRRDRRPRQLLDGTRRGGHRAARRRAHRRRPVLRRGLRHVRATRRPAAASCRATATSRSTSSSKPRSTPGTPGAFELEVVGPAIEAEGHGAALRRRVERANDCCTRCSREPGDRLQRRRDLGGARPPGARAPQPGGAVLRVEATGLCHSDFDHFQGRVHTPWGGEFPSIAGHEIVGPDRAASIRRPPREWGVDEGDRVAVRDMVVDRRRLPHLRPRLLGRRGLRTVRRVRRAPGAPARLDGVPPPRRPSGRGAHLLRAVELRGDVGAPDPAKATSSSSKGRATWAWRRSSPRAPRVRRRSSSPASRRIDSASTPRCASVPIT